MNNISKRSKKRQFENTLVCLSGAQMGLNREKKLEVENLVTHSLSRNFFSVCLNFSQIFLFFKTILLLKWPNKTFRVRFLPKNLGSDWLRLWLRNPDCVTVLRNFVITN